MNVSWNLIPNCLNISLCFFNYCIWISFIYFPRKKRRLIWLQPNTSMKHDRLIFRFSMQKLYEIYFVYLAQSCYENMPISNLIFFHYINSISSARLGSPDHSVLAQSFGCLLHPIVFDKNKIKNCTAHNCYRMQISV